jgi:type VI secretion system protein ImpH
MATIFGWGEDTTVADWLRAEPQRFEFPQAVRLLEQIGGAASVRLAAHATFAFPPSEVAGLQAGPRQAVLTASLLTLGGALGPLPATYTEEHWRHQPFAEFLDIFHHRLLWLLYQIRRLYAPALAGDTEEHAIEHAMERALFAIAGLGAAGLRHRLATPDAALPHYAAWLGREVRSAHGLEQVLGHFLGISVQVRQFQGRWAKLDRRQRTHLGQSQHRLGSQAVLGSRAWDDHAAVEIQCGPLPAEMFDSLLPGGWRSAAVRDLITLYLGERQTFTFRLLLPAAEAPRGQLGRARLGYTSFLGRARQAAEVPVTRFGKPMETRR